LFRTFRKLKSGIASSSVRDRLRRPKRACQAGHGSVMRFKAAAVLRDHLLSRRNYMRQRDSLVEYLEN
jgi:hypothetical protein